jgi:formamidopyrimidine-DNA glycosylase
MPELPEVETTRRDIMSAVVGRRIAAVTVYDRRLRWPVPPDLPRILADRRVLALDRRSKYLLFRFDAGTMIVHFGMTGSLRILAEAPPRRPHDHIDWRLDDGAILRYHDPRRFGAVLWTTSDPYDHPLLRDLGPEPLAAGFDGDALWTAARTRNVPVKSLLMDSHVVVGVGNIYANEALYYAGIRPATPARRVSRARMARLADAVRSVLHGAIDQGGSTLRDYVNGRGEPGRAQLGYFVYGRDGAPCRVCATPVRSRYIGQRNTFYCPNCQK